VLARKDRPLEVLNDQGKKLVHSDFAFSATLDCDSWAQLRRLPFSSRKVLQNFNADLSHFFIKIDVFSCIGDPRLTFLFFLLLKDHSADFCFQSLLSFQHLK